MMTENETHKNSCGREINFYIFFIFSKNRTETEFVARFWMFWVVIVLWKIEFSSTYKIRHHFDRSTLTHKWIFVHFQRNEAFEWKISQKLMFCITNYDFYASYVGIIMCMFILVSCWISFSSSLSRVVVCTAFYLFPFYVLILYVENSSYSISLLLCLTLPYLATYRSILNVLHVVVFFIFLDGEYISTSTAHNIKVEFLTFFYYYISLHRNHPKSSSSIYPLTHRY